MTPIINVGCGEYSTCYLQDNNKIYSVLWNGKHQYMEYPGISNVTGVTGGQYTCLCWTGDGVAYELSKGANGGPVSTKISLTASKIAYAQMFLQAKILVDTFGDLYYMAETAAKDVMKFGSTSIPKLILAGQNIVKVEVGEDFRGMLMLSKSGEVYQWVPGKTAPTKVSVPSCVDIAVIGRGAFVVNTGTTLMTWGDRLEYVGLRGSSSTPVSLGGSIMKWPLKKMVGNWNTLHIIDANGDMWACGENIMGEIGNGQGCSNWKTYLAADSKTSQPFAWNWLPSQMMQPPIKLDGKWSNVFSSGSMAFYIYALSEDGRLYSWGRNKKRALGNGRTLADNSTMDNYPNWEDVWYPMEVSPETVSWSIISSFDPKTASNNYPLDKIPPITSGTTTTTSSSTSTSTSTTTSSTTSTTTTKPLPKVLCIVEAGYWKWHLLDDGSSFSENIN